jgi:hypothetical protein
MLDEIGALRNKVQMTDETQCPGNLESTLIGHLHQLLTLECETVMAAGRTDLVGTLADQVVDSLAPKPTNANGKRAKNAAERLDSIMHAMRTASPYVHCSGNRRLSTTDIPANPANTIDTWAMPTSASLNGKASTNAEPASLPGLLAYLGGEISSIIRRSTLPGPGGNGASVTPFPVPD